MVPRELLTAEMILLIGLLDAWDQYLSKKDRKKFGAKMMARSQRSLIPPNGMGPVNAERVKALAILDDVARIRDLVASKVMRAP